MKGVFDILIILLVIVGFVSAVYFIFTNEDIPINGDVTDCFDRYGNKIIGESCIVEGGFNSVSEYYASMFLISILMLVFLLGFVWFMIETSGGFT